MTGRSGVHQKRKRADKKSRQPSYKKFETQSGGKTQEVLPQLGTKRMRQAGMWRRQMKVPSRPTRQAREGLLEALNELMVIPDGLWTTLASQRIQQRGGHAGKVGFDWTGEDFRQSRNTQN